MRFALLLAAVLATPLPAIAETLVVHASDVPDEKAIVATVEPVHELTARARIGGTMASLSIKEGDRVAAGAGDRGRRRREARPAGTGARIPASSRSSPSATRRRPTSIGRSNSRSAASTRRCRSTAAKTALDVAERTLEAMRSDRDVIAQQMKEGAVLAPGAGRVLRAPVSEGSVVLPGETIATIAEDHYILRLQLPERHARFMRAGDVVKIGERGFAEDGAAKRGAGPPRLSGNPGRPRHRRRRGARGRRLFRRRANPGLCRDRRAARDRRPARLRLSPGRGRLRQAQGWRGGRRPARLRR